MKLKPCYFKIPIIGNEHFVYVCVDNRKNGLKRLRQYFKKSDGKSFELKDLEVRGKTFIREELHPFIWVDIEREGYLSSVAHEAFHSVLSIFQFIEQKVEGAEECFAIAVSSIVRVVEQETKL